jgi:hypothetical protein
MIRELQIIFGRDAITLQLRIPRQRLIFFMELRRIAACAIVDAIAAFGTTTIATIGPWCTCTTATATTTAVLTIIDQLSDVLVTGGIG